MRQSINDQLPAPVLKNSSTVSFALVQSVKKFIIFHPITLIFDEHEICQKFNLILNLSNFRNVYLSELMLNFGTR